MTNKSPPLEKPSRRDMLLRGALMVIATEGVDAITHRRVGKAAGVSHGVASYHFKTRDDLVNEAFLFHLEALKQLGNEITLNKDVTTLADLFDLVVEFVERDQASPYWVYADYELILYASRNPSLAKIFREWEGSVAVTLAEQLVLIDVKEPMRTARIIVNMIRAFELECMTNPTLDLAEFRKRLELFESGIG